MRNGHQLSNTATHLTLTGYLDAKLRLIARRRDGFHALRMHQTEDVGLQEGRAASMAIIVRLGELISNFTTALIILN